MGQIARLAIFGVATILTLLSYFLPWFHIDLMDGLDVELNAIPFRGTSGLEVVLCDGCPSVGTGRLPGGLAWLASYVGVVFAVALVASIAQALRGFRHPTVTAWSTLSAVGLGLLVLGVFVTFEAPRGVDVGVSAEPGIWMMLGACVLALVGHSRLLDRLDPPPLIEAAPPPLPVERLQPVETPARRPTTLVRAADVGHAGMRITTDAGSTRLAWDDILRIQLITGLEPGVELTTRDAILRINRKTDADYRFLPGVTDGTAADNLRRLYDYARERNPALRHVP